MNSDKEKIVSDTVKYIQNIELQRKMVEETIEVRAEELKRDYKEYIESSIIEEEKEHQIKMKELKDIANQTDEEKIENLKKFLKKRFAKVVLNR